MNIKKIVASVAACCLVCGGLPVVRGGFSESAVFALTEIYGDLKYEVYGEEIRITGCSADAVSVEIPDEIAGKAVTVVSWNAFSGCSALESVTIPEGVTIIDNGAFNHCAKLESITIPESVTFIGRDAFIGTKWLADRQAESPFVIVNNILIDGAKCKGDVVIPDGVENIGVYAFIYCSAVLKSVTIPDSVTTISKYAFNSCKYIESVTMSASVTKIEDDAFWNCISLKDVYYSGSEEDWNKIEIGDKNDSLLNATIHYNYKPEEKTIIGDTNGDGLINAIDASLILSEYASVSTGGSAVSEGEAAAYDVNGDGYIDAKDASIILEYYSVVSTTSEDVGDIVSWLKNQENTGG